MNEFKLPPNNQKDVARGVEKSPSKAQKTFDEMTFEEATDTLLQIVGSTQSDAEIISRLKMLGVSEWDLQFTNINYTDGTKKSKLEVIWQGPNGNKLVEVIY